MRLSAGAHALLDSPFVPLRGWYPIEFLHFPIRSFEQYDRKHRNLRAALGPSRNAYYDEVLRSRQDGRLRDFYEALAEDRKIEVSVQGAGRLHADPVLFRRALSNLLSNALNHTPEDGHVRIGLREAPDALVVSVADDGHGMPEEHLPRVFDRFYRISDAPGRSHGSGLGLAIVKSIVDLHGGGVHLQSAPGKGTVVEMRFPRRVG